MKEASGNAKALEGVWRSGWIGFGERPLDPNSDSDSEVYFIIFELAAHAYAFYTPELFNSSFSLSLSPHPCPLSHIVKRTTVHHATYYCYALLPLSSYYSFSCSCSCSCSCSLPLPLPLPIIIIHRPSGVLILPHSVFLCTCIHQVLYMTLFLVSFFFPQV